LSVFLGIRPFSAVKDETKEPRFLEQVELFFNRAASKTGISKDYLELIRTCDNYRAQHKHHKLPVKGGTRYDAGIDL
jgi:glutamate dehydrogenase (NAD(P)+)